MSQLEREQIVFAKKQIKKMHPLNNLEVELCLPFLDPVIGVTRRCFGGKSAVYASSEETKGLADNDGLKDPENGKTKEDEDMGNAVDEDGDPLFDFDLEEGEDPIGRLGYGVVSYFSLIYTMMLIFGLITLFFVPIIMNNMNWIGYDGDLQISWTAQTTLGNYGESTSRCTTLKMVGDRAVIGCETGVITEISHFGVYAKDSEADQRGLCSSEGVEVDTGLSCASISSKEHPFFTEKLSTCIGKQSCIMNSVHDELPIGSQPSSSDCVLKENSSLFIQYSCEINEDELIDKRYQALWAGCTSVFSCLVLLSVLKYRANSISIEKREWDIQTVTASDYTIEFKISQKQYDDIKAKMDNESFMYYDAEGLRFKLYLQKIIEDRVKELSGGQEGRVADINFGYKNGDLLDYLYKRGDYIKYKQWDQLNLINKEITRDMHENMATYTTPVCAFVCMETEEAYNHIAPSGKLDIFGTQSTIKEAVEPTNIIWENRYFDKTTRAVRLLFIIIAVCTVLFITFLITTYAKGVTNDTIGKYDDSIKCSELEKMYDAETLQKLAADEWVDYYEHGGEDMDRLISSDLSCFCTEEYQRVGSAASGNVYISSSGEKVKTCSEIFADRALVGYIAMAVSMMIVAVNFVLKVILVELIKSLRLKTVTAETNYTMIAIFVGQFVNTAVLVVINNASFHDFDGGVGPLSQIFRVGTLTDFNVLWYKSVGTILMKAMLMAGLWPLIEFGMFWSMITFFRCLDKNFGSDTFYTNSPSIQAYIDTWAGPMYLIHYRYATILLQIGVAFMYGTGMPLLYFYAFLAYVILYLNERLLVCYYYREPPTFDEKMTMLCIDLSSWVPYIMLPFGFWMLGNRQIFENVIHQINYKSDIRLSGHTISQSFSHMDPRHLTYNSAPLWLFIFLIIFDFIKYYYFPDDEEDEGDDQLVEGLENYFDAFKKDDKQVTIGSEETMIKQYGVKTLSDQQFSDVKNAKEDVEMDKIIMGIPSYRILESRTYQQAFQYEPALKKDDGTCGREGNIFISTQQDEDPKNLVNEPLQHDVTYLACNLAYIPANKRASLNFDTSEGKSIF